MDIEDLYNKIFELTQNENIFIEESTSEIKIWATFGDSETYNIYLSAWYEYPTTIIRQYKIDFHLRGKGIGSNFYCIFEEYIKSCGYNEMKLHLVLTSAQKFWIYRGFLKDTWSKTI